MKDFFISSNDKVQIKTADTTTLPALIRLNQYEYSSTLNTLSNSMLFKKEYSNGYMGSNYYDFAFIINHHNDGKLKILYEKLYNKKTGDPHSYREILIRKNEITDNFLILEIPDYGAQAMSPFFTDFVPHIYINGSKLWQRYFCMLKHYSKKIVYILIEKNNNLGIEDITDLQEKMINIRICFKNNIEKTYRELKERDDKSPSIKVTLSSNDGLEFSGFIDNDKYYESIQSQFFNSGSFSSEKYNLSTLNDFDFITSGIITDVITKTFNGRETIKINKTDCYKMIHPTFIKKLRFEKESQNLVKDIATNTKSNDYFKQIYEKENKNNSNLIYERPESNKIKVTLILKEKLSHKDCGNIREILLVSKSNLKDAFYSDEEENFNLEDKKFDFDYNGKNYSRFNEKGEYELNGEKYEFIPEYTSTRKIIFTGSGNIKSKIKETYPTLYRWNLENAFEFGYKNGLLETSDFDTYFIYDSGENEINETIEGTGSITNILFSTDDINNKGEIIRETRNYEHTISNDKKKIIFKDRIPLSFYFRLKDMHAIRHQNLKVNAVSRSFIIPYETHVIDNYTLLCKVPDYFIFNDKLNNNYYNSNLNKNFLNSTETTLYISEIIECNCIEHVDDEPIYKGLYNVDGYNKELSSNDYYPNDNSGYYEDTKLVNNNIVNFSNRNIET